MRVEHDIQPAAERPSLHGARVKSPTDKIDYSSDAKNLKIVFLSVQISLSMARSTLHTI